MREMEMFANNGVVNRKGFRFVMPIGTYLIQFCDDRGYSEIIVNNNTNIASILNLVTKRN